MSTLCAFNHIYTYISKQFSNIVQPSDSRLVLEDHLGPRLGSRRRRRSFAGVHPHERSCHPAPSASKLAWTAQCFPAPAVAMAPDHTTNGIQQLLEMKINKNATLSRSIWITTPWWSPYLATRLVLLLASLICLDDSLFSQATAASPGSFFLFFLFFPPESQTTSGALLGYRQSCWSNDCRMHRWITGGNRINLDHQHHFIRAR